MRLTLRDGVREQVIALLKKRTPVNHTATREDLIKAYKIIRLNAIADTIFFKRLCITIRQD